jgi:DNA-binding NarL/FixJ family response regulator
MKTKPHNLTPRETEVLKLIVEGHSSKCIARQLNIAFKTVRCHRSRIMDKLQVHNAASLVRFAIRQGIVVATIMVNWCVDYEVLEGTLLVC